jgi:hypothetical protein
VEGHDGHLEGEADEREPDAQPEDDPRERPSLSSWAPMSVRLVLPVAP